MLSEGPGLGLLRLIGISKNLRTARQRRSSKVLQLAAMALLRAHWHFDPSQPKILFPGSWVTPCLEVWPALESSCGCVHLELDSKSGQNDSTDQQQTQVLPRVTFMKEVAQVDYHPEKREI